MSNREDRTIASAEVDSQAYETAKDRLPYGGISEEIRSLIERIAYGDELGQRSRLEQRLQELRNQRRELEEERREIDARIDNLGSRIQSVESEISQLSAEEERYEAKIEGLEYRLRNPDNGHFHLTTELSSVAEIAKSSGKSPEGVVKDVRERNPDIPDYAFESPPPMHERDPLHNPVWEGVPESEIDTPVEKREEWDR